MHAKALTLKNRKDIVDKLTATNMDPVSTKLSYMVALIQHNTVFQTGFIGLRLR